LRQRDRLCSGIFPKKPSELKIIFRNVLHLRALGLEIVWDFVNAIRPFARRHPELDESKPRAKVREASVIAQLRHSNLEQQVRAIAVWTHDVVAGPCRPQAGSLGRLIGFIDEA
jgi:hypothetical protein